MVIIALLIICAFVGVMFLIGVLFESNESTNANRTYQSKSQNSNATNQRVSASMYASRERNNIHVETQQMYKKSDTNSPYIPPVLPYNANSHRHSADQEWERGSIVNVGFQKNCIVREVKDYPLHYYLKQLPGNI